MHTVFIIVPSAMITTTTSTILSTITINATGTTPGPSTNATVLASADDEAGV